MIRKYIVTTALAIACGGMLASAQQGQRPASPTPSPSPATGEASRQTSSTFVGLPAAGIQGRIDTASPGDTIIVDPGFYNGPLYFGGKNITLRSRDGPSATIIHGSGGTGEPISAANRSTSARPI